MPVVPTRPVCAAGPHDQADREQGDLRRICGCIRMMRIGEQVGAQRFARPRQALLL